MTQNHILTTRSLTLSDFEAWFVLWDAYLSQNNVEMGWRDQISLFRTLVHRRQNSAALVVECAGAIVGIAHYQIHSADFTFEHAYLVQDLYVLPVYHKHRAGAELVRAVYQTSRENGVASVYWMAAEKTYRGGDCAAVTSPFLQFRKVA